MNSYSIKIKLLIQKNPCALIFVCCTVLLSVLLPELVSAQTYVPLTEIPGFKDAAASGSFSDLINVIYKMAIGIGSIMAVFMIIWAGVQYMTSTNASNMQGLKEKILGALGGLVFLLAAFAILAIVNPEINSLQVSELSESPSKQSHANFSVQNTDGTATSQTGNLSFNPSEYDPISTITFEDGVADLIPENLYANIIEVIPKEAFVEPNIPRVSAGKNGTGSIDPNPQVSSGSGDAENVELSPEESSALNKKLDNDRQLKCMAINMYWEARSEPDYGMEMVAHTVMNRLRYNIARKNNLPKDVCGVVYREWQFSWTMDPKVRNKVPNDRKNMDRALRIAHSVMYKDKKASSPLDKSCVLFYKRTDNRGVSAKSVRLFNSLRPGRLRAVGAHSFYCHHSYP